MASASQSQVFVAPDTGPQAPAFVVAAASVTKHMYGSIVRLITDRYPDARITAIDARTLSNLHERQRHQLKRFNASTRRTPEEKRLLMTIRKPVTTVDLFRDRHGDEPRLVVLRGHALSGSEKLSGIRFSKIAAALKANGLQNHDVITLTACFGADSLNFNSADIAELDRSSMGYENKGRKVLPPAQNLANALGDVGLPGCLVVASHNVHSEWPSKSRKTRKIMFDERNGQQFSATMDGLHHSSLADASRIFRCNAAPSKLLTKLDAAERERVEPAIAYLRSVKPPELPTAFSPPAA